MTTAFDHVVTGATATAGQSVPILAVPTARSAHSDLLEHDGGNVGAYHRSNRSVRTRRVPRLSNHQRHDGPPLVLFYVGAMVSGTI